MEKYEVTFDVEGDLGIGIKQSKKGNIVVKELKQLIGYAERNAMEDKSKKLNEGDVLFAIDGVCVLNNSFHENMRKLRASRMTRPTQLSFLRVGGTDTPANILKMYNLHQQQQDGVKVKEPGHEGEFRLHFQPNQPFGMKFKLSHLMVHPPRIQLRADVRLTNEMTLSTSHVHYIVRIDEHLTLSAPYDEVLKLLFEDSINNSFPKVLWLASINETQEVCSTINDNSSLEKKKYLIMNINSKDDLKNFTFEKSKVMVTAPVIFAFRTPSSQCVKRLDAEKNVRSDGVKIGQFLLAINNISVLDWTYHDVLEFIHNLFLLNLPRELLLRDVDAYRTEHKLKRPLSPWNRSRGSLPFESTTYDSRDICLDDAAEFSIEIEERFYTLNEFIPQTQKLFCETSHGPGALISIADCCVGARQCWKQSKCSYLTVIKIPDNKLPVGIQLETSTIDSRYTVFYQYTRSFGLANSKGIRTGDCILEVNGQSVEHIPTDFLVKIIQNNNIGNHTVLNRTLVFGRYLKNSHFFNFINSGKLKDC